MCGLTEGPAVASEHSRLGPQHPHIGQALAAERDRQGHIQKDLPRIMHHSRLAPRRMSRRWRPIQPGLADVLAQQDTVGLRDHRPTTAPDADADARVGTDTLLHLESASDSGRNKDLNNPHSCWSGALSDYPTTRRTPGFMKARG